MAFALGSPATAGHPAGQAAGPVGLSPPPEPTQPPTVTGTTRVGATLAGDDGQWEGEPTLARYWLRCDSTGSGCEFIHQTGPSYTLTMADLGKRIRLRVLATTPAGAREVESAPTEVVAPPPPPPQPPAPAGPKPEVIVPPNLDGTFREGRTVRVQSGSWRGLEPLTFGQRWERCDAKRCVPTAVTGLQYLLGPADVGRRVRAKVTATNPAGSVSDFTEQSVTVRPKPRPPELLKPFPRIEISGFIMRGGARLRRLAVRAPRGSTVRLTCRGRTCPVRISRARLRSDLFVVGQMRGAVLKGGTIIEMRVTRPGKIGKYTRFRIRGGTKPARIDRCLVPGRSRPSRCPSAS